MPLLSLAYVKGFSRVAIAHAMIANLLQHNIDIALEMLRLHKSILIANVYNIVVSCKTTQALHNANMSNKRAFRKAWNRITWVGCMRSIVSTSNARNTVINQWNKNVEWDNMILGARASCVQCVLPPRSLHRSDR